MPTFVHGKTPTSSSTTRQAPSSICPHTATTSASPGSLRRRDHDLRQRRQDLHRRPGDAKLSFSGKFDATLDAHARRHRRIKAGTLTTASGVFGPAGSASGKVKHTFETIVTSYEVSEKVSDVVEFKAELQVTGAVTRTTF